MRTPLVLSRRSRGLTLTAAALGAVAVPTLASAASGVRPPRRTRPPRPPRPWRRLRPPPWPPPSPPPLRPRRRRADRRRSPPPRRSRRRPKAAAPQSSTYTVRAGDTLSGIAQAKLGDGNKYPEIFKLNTGKAQTDGQHLQDPNLILIGWVLNLPGADGTAAPAATSNQPVVESAPVKSTPVKAAPAAKATTRRRRRRRPRRRRRRRAPRRRPAPTPTTWTAGSSRPSRS